MTIIREFVTTSIGGRNRQYKKHILELQCDQCNKIYVCPVKYRQRAFNSTLHFCSKECSTKSSKNGKLKNSFQSSILKKYGKFFVETNKFKSDQVAKCLELYGVKSRLEAPIIKEKIKKTCMAKYGRETFAGSVKHQSKLDYHEISRKAWATKIKNGTCSKSKVEERVFDILIDVYPDIKRQFRFERQWIDFYIPSIQLYLQVDGVYWHGINKSKDDITLQKTSQGKRIYKQMLRDEYLNKTMKSSGLKLLRLTDEQINKMSNEDIISCIRNYDANL